MIRHALGKFLTKLKLNLLPCASERPSKPFVLGFVVVLVTKVVSSIKPALFQHAGLRSKSSDLKFQDCDEGGGSSESRTDSSEDEVTEHPPVHVAQHAALPARHGRGQGAASMISDIAAVFGRPVEAIGHGRAPNYKSRTVIINQLSHLFYNCGLLHTRTNPLFNSVPTISVTPHRPGVLEDSLQQLRRLHAAVQHMRAAPLPLLVISPCYSMACYCAPQSGSARLSTSCPSLKDGAAEPECSSPINLEFYPQSRKGSGESRQWSMWEGRDEGRRSSWAALEPVARVTETRRQRTALNGHSASLSSMESEGEAPRPVRHSTHSLNDNDLAKDFEKVTAALRAGCLGSGLDVGATAPEPESLRLQPRLPLQKSVSTPSIVAAIQPMLQPTQQNMAGRGKGGRYHGDITRAGQGRMCDFEIRLSTGAASETESDDERSAVARSAGAASAHLIGRRNNTHQEHLGLRQLAYLEQAAYDHHAEKRRKRGSLFFRKKKDKSRKAAHAWQAAGASGDCDWCGRAFSDKPSLYCDNCTMTVHQNGCKDYIVECNKPKTSKTSVGKSLSASSGKGNKRSSVSSQSQNTNSLPNTGPKRNPITTRACMYVCMCVCCVVVGLWLCARAARSRAPGATRRGVASLQNWVSNDAAVTEWPEAQLTAEQLGDEAVALGLGAPEPDTWAAGANKGLAKLFFHNEVMFAEGMMRAGGVTSAQIGRMFPCLGELWALHATLLTRLRARQRLAPTVTTIADILADAFTASHGDKLKAAYGEFCSRHREAVEVFKECCTREPRLARFIRKCQQNPLLRKKEILVDVDNQVAAKEREDRKLEIYHRIDAKSFANFRGRKFKKETDESGVGRGMGPSSDAYALNGGLCFGRKAEQEGPSSGPRDRRSKDLQAAGNSEILLYHMKMLSPPKWCGRESDFLLLFFKVKLLMARGEPKTIRKCVTLNNKGEDVRNNRRIIGRGPERYSVSCRWQLRHISPLRTAEFGKFEGVATLMQGRSKMQTLLVIVLTDVLFFLHDNNNKYTFFTPDNKTGVVSLVKLLVREKAGAEGRGLYLICSGPAEPEMFELRVHRPKDITTWITAIRAAVQQCPEELEETEVNAHAVSAEERQRQLEARHENIRLITEALRAKDREHAAILEEKMALHMKMVGYTTGTSTLDVPNTGNVIFPGGLVFPDYVRLAVPSADTHAIWQEVNKVVKEALEASSAAWGAGGGLGRSTSSAGEKHSVAYESPALPRRADTFAGFDKNRHKGVTLRKPDDPADDDVTDCPTGSEAALKLQHSVYTLTCIVWQQLTTIHSLEAQVCAWRSCGGAPPTRCHDTQLEELRTAQARLCAERASWETQRAADQQSLDQERRQLEEARRELAEQQKDVEQQRERLYRRLERLQQHGGGSQEEIASVGTLSPDSSISDTTRRKEPKWRNNRGSTGSESSVGGVGPGVVRGTSLPPPQLLSAQNETRATVRAPAITQMVKQQLPLKLASGKSQGSTTSSNSGGAAPAPPGYQRLHESPAEHSGVLVVSHGRTGSSPAPLPSTPAAHHLNNKATRS
ncbi:A-kinase anchor protein 13 [Eumeta japonica]|uniref:A-kinase anchor protein 13 n=1 Tax=Eumeta variegata TaxID=151549 RepID=A0A4C1WIA0_EUMVA|nr:A-kinase anchor protein 13 [Eumeta japonica]